jgi:multidrug transporter EmrE-like cation transporter
MRQMLRTKEGDVRLWIALPLYIGTIVAIGFLAWGVTNLPGMDSTIPYARAIGVVLVIAIGVAVYEAVIHGAH